MLAVLSPHLSADEVTVMNDSISAQTPQSVGVGGFEPGEMAAAWLTMPCDGTIVALQVAWVSNDVNALPSLQRAIHVYRSGTFPNVGAEVLLIEGPQLSVNTFNEFRFLDENQTIPVNVPVTSGETIVVALEFDEPTIDPTIARDINGCQAGRNGINAIVGQQFVWFSACDQGVLGDFAIRAVVDCQAQAQDFGFRAATSSVAEDAGIATIEVEITNGGATAGPGTIQYAVTGGTATAGGAADFTLLGNGTLSFAQNDTIKSIGLVVNDDSANEQDETIEITLSNPTGGYTLGAAAIHTVTITDNDAAAAGTSGVKVR
jgi:hypothetical protein